MITPELWPLGAAVDRRGRLAVGGAALVGLAERYGTPLYVYDAPTVRAAYRAYREAFRPYGPVRVSYALKACPLLGVAGAIAALGADASAASLGELLAARRARFPAARIQLHGNAKTEEELRGALRARTGRIVIDGAEEIERLDRLTRRRARPQPVWLRVSPGIAVDTHPHLRTGALDSKFGAPLETGDALAQARAISRVRGLRLVGVHAHLGTELREAEAYRELSRALVTFARAVRAEAGARIREVGVGGGLAVPLRPEDRALDLAAYAAAVSGPVREDAELAGAAIYVEPGRSLVGRAGVALYTVVGIKRVPGVRTFVAVDGGMGDNIRPALYGAAYTALLAGRPEAPPAEEVAVAGKYCESGDLLIRSVALPAARPGEILAIPGAGAYALAMASNYNHHVRPAVVLLDRGRARLVRRRETHADLWRLERR
ncbi:MAG TPA: diaminopimelate decarboxylase [Candidatus Limnocylindrales bacterium]|nr:diaminopimelate decarboxylase [Candidatus Limnocylindrales bacterium]